MAFLQSGSFHALSGRPSGQIGGKKNRKQIENRKQLLFDLQILTCPPTTGTNSKYAINLGIGIGILETCYG